MKLIRLALMTLTLAAAAACGDKATSPNPPGPPAPPPQPPPPPPGSAVVTLATPNSDDGAVVVKLTGPGLSTFETASSGYIFYSRLAAEQEARVIVVGNVTAGPLFTFKVATGSAVSAYTATIEQVANRTDALRASTASYTLTIAAAP
jgi:hypothetical protein